MLQLDLVTQLHYTADSDPFARGIVEQLRLQVALSLFQKK